MARARDDNPHRLPGAMVGVGGGLAVLLFLSAGRLAAQEFSLFSPAMPPEHYFSMDGGGGSQSFDLELSRGSAPEAPAVLPQSPGITSQVPARPPNAFVPLLPRIPTATKSALLTVGVLAGSAASAFWSGHERTSFNFANEEWFGEQTYAGGADKASHFVFYNGLSRGLNVAYQDLGYSRDKAVAMAFGTSVLAGLIVEVGDGLTVFGFAWEDFAMDTLGAGTAALITHYGLDDTVGFRFGKVSADQPPECCRTPGLGKDYSEEIYTADLKLAGFLPRVKLRPGLTRFLLFSMSYGSKGYRYSPPEFRQRNIGLELGLNFPEILAAAGLPRNKWWEQLIYGFFNFVRIPYTSVGMYYDLNSGKWSGPNNGNVYYPGP